MSEREADGVQREAVYTPRAGWDGESNLQSGDGGGGVGGADRDCAAEGGAEGEGGVGVGWEDD